MKISVVIPAYNEEKYIEKCLDSLVGQDYDNFEIVVCLNVCIDKTEEIAKKYKKVKLIKEKRKSVSIARQTGTKIASGEIIVSADADTKYSRDWLSKINSLFQKNPQIIGFYGPVYLYDGTFLVKILAKIFYLLFLYLSKLFGHDNPAGMNFSFKKEIFDKVGGYNINLKSAEDIDLAKRMKKYGKIKVVPSLKVFSSARRFRLGFFKFFIHHLRNYLKVFLFKKEPENIEDVR